MQEPLVAIHMVTWNSLPYLRFCLESLAKQTYKNISITVIDNASRDDTVRELNAWRSNLESRFDLVTLIQNHSNRGFAAAHNQGLQNLTHGEKYILVLNPDVILTPNYLATMVEIMEREPKVAGITGQLLRYTLENKSQFPNPNDQTNPNFQIPMTKQIKFTNIVDSEGLEMLPWRAVRERHAGRMAYSKWPIANGNSKLTPDNHTPYAIRYMPVWGISGACALYRLSALDDIKKRGFSVKNKTAQASRAWCPAKRDERGRAIKTGESLDEPSLVVRTENPSEYFDEDFFCYKEDVDMAWRMSTHGWKFLYTPCTQAFHHRGVGHDTPRPQRGLRINQWSYRNHFYTLLKNEPMLDFILHAPLILGYELAKFCYYLIVQPRTLLSLWDVCTNLPRMVRKRKYLMCNYPSSS